MHAVKEHANGWGAGQRGNTALGLIKRLNTKAADDTHTHTQTIITDDLGFILFSFASSHLHFCVCVCVHACTADRLLLDTFAFLLLTFV